MLRHLAASLVAATSDRLNRGRSALVWTLATVGLGSVGLGLMLATVVMELSRLIGPVLACGLLGLGFVLLALLITTLRRSRHATLLPPLPAIPAPEQLAFALGFVLIRRILANGK